MYSQTNAGNESICIQYLHLNMLVSLWYDPCIQSSLPVLGPAPLARLHYIVSDKWNEAGISVAQIFKAKN